MAGNKYYLAKLSEKISAPLYQEMAFSCGIRSYIAVGGKKEVKRRGY